MRVNKGRATYLARRLLAKRPPMPVVLPARYGKPPTAWYSSTLLPGWMCHAWCVLAWKHGVASSVGAVFGMPPAAELDRAYPQLCEALRCPESTRRAMKTALRKAVAFIASRPAIAKKQKGHGGEGTATRGAFRVFREGAEHFQIAHEICRRFSRIPALRLGCVLGVVGNDWELLLQGLIMED